MTVVAFGWLALIYFVYQRTHSAERYWHRQLSKQQKQTAEKKV